MSRFLRCAGGARLSLFGAAHWPIAVAGALDFLGAMVQRFGDCLKTAASN